LKNYYDLLELPAAASTDDVKRAFRQQIARYHPDKVQHLGKEFQAMAADRAAELTEAYRILSDAGRRAEYDQALSGTPRGAASAAAAAPVPGAGVETPSNDPTAESFRPGGSAHQFFEERAGRDEFVRKATIGRFRQVFTKVAGGAYDESRVVGFDIGCVPKTKMFARAKGPRLLGRFVPRVDGAAVADAWAQAGKWKVPEGEEICVFLMGTLLAPARELAEAIAEQRRRPLRGGRVTLIPVNASVWDAHLPTDAPAIAKDMLVQLRNGS
jgi:hypothetical protein